MIQMSGLLAMSYFSWTFSTSLNFNRRHEARSARNREMSSIKIYLGFSVMNAIHIVLRAVLALQNSTKNQTEKEELFSILKNNSTKLN